jgi:hypothetical protein
MIVELPASNRTLRTVRQSCDLVVVGGGLSGVCCAITAARAGIKVVLVQDRPVLGGNASSEVRLWILGATSHMGNNNRWAREGGVIDEILVENMHRNPEGNPLILDTILLELVLSESNITLLLNTAVHDLEKDGDDRIKSVRAFCSQNSTCYEISAPLFCDASGDGIVGFLAGAAFRIGAESSDEFGEKFAPPAASSELLGHSIYFYSKDTGRPVKFTAPSFALSDITQIPRWRDFKAGQDGCRLWWIEWGGSIDTIHDSELIKMELWKVAYGVWHHIKNSGQFPEAETLTLEWVGTIPGKRESRRFEGDLILTQQDIVEQRLHPDAVSFGGWAIDLHPVEGVYSAQSGCTQWHSKGVYQIPWRTMYSRNISNLMLAGRIISASHVAFGSTRVMATCAHGGQAVAIAAALCLRDGILPRDLTEPARMRELQCRLLRSGQFIPGVSHDDSEDLARHAKITASSELALSELPASGETLPLTESWAMMLPVSSGRMPVTSFTVDVGAATTLRAELRISEKPDNHTPDIVLKSLDLPLSPGLQQPLLLDFETDVDETRFVFVCLLKNDNVAAHLSDQRLTGVLALCQAGNKAVAKSNTQSPPPGIGIDTFEFWTPKRRPAGKNLALRCEPPLRAFSVENLTNGISRPTRASNAWAADFSHEQPIVRLTWDSPQTIKSIEIDFDTDFDHPMESVLMGHPERDMPFCLRDVRITCCPVNDASGTSGQSPVATHIQKATRTIAEIIGNHQTRRVITFETPVPTDCLELHVLAPSAHVPAALFAVRCYGG